MTLSCVKIPKNIIFYSWHNRQITRIRLEEEWYRDRCVRTIDSIDPSQGEMSIKVQDQPRPKGEIKEEKKGRKQ